MAITDKQIEEALDNEFDGVDGFLMVQEILQLRAENTELKAKLKERHEYIQNGMVDMALTKWRMAEAGKKTYHQTLEQLMSYTKLGIGTISTIRAIIAKALKEPDGKEDKQPN